jgi:hypothetical protein
VEAVITLAPIQGARPFCSVCGQDGGRLHMHGTRRVRDLNLAHARVDGIAIYVDIRFRMLTNRELARAMSFEDGDYEYHFTGTEEEITRQIGNAVPTRTARALCGAMLLWDVIEAHGRGSEPQVRRRREVGVTERGEGAREGSPPAEPSKAWTSDGDPNAGLL